MKRHILDKRREYARLLQQALTLGVSKADFRYNVVEAANSATYVLQENGQVSDWADECLNAARDLVSRLHEEAAEAEVDHLKVQDIILNHEAVQDRIFKNLRDHD